jgi:acetoin utilization protein AcuB
MRVADLMQTDLVTVRSDDLVRVAVERLAEEKITGLPVVDGHGGLVGVLSASDILQAESLNADPEAVARLLDDTVVREIMTPRPHTIAPTATSKEAAQRMMYLEVHRLFVEEGGRLLGVITTSDLVRSLAMSKV